MHAKEAVLQEAFKKKVFCKFVSSSSWDPTETIPYDSWSKLETVLQRVATCAPKKLFSKKCAPQKLFSRCHFGWPRKMFSKSWCRSSSCSLRLCCSEHFQIFWRFFCCRPPSKKKVFSYARIHLSNVWSQSRVTRSDVSFQTKKSECLVTMSWHPQTYAPLSKTLFFSNFLCSAPSMSRRVIRILWIKTLLFNDFG